MEIKSSSPASLAEAKKVLAQRQKEGELGYEQTQALEHAEKFSNTEPDKADKLVEALKKHDKISDGMAVKIADIHPSEAATLKCMLAKERIEITDEEAAEIIKIIS